MAITPGARLNSKIVAGTAVFGAASQAVNTLQRLSSVTDTSKGVVSAIRSINLPAGGEAIGDIFSAVSAFGDAGANENDWRVRLSLPTWPSFRTSPVLRPLKDAGGLIFPFTPQITLRSNARYSSDAPTHSNYPFQAYRNSDPGNIDITAPMNVEDNSQALYWIAAVHYLRSITKMFTGSDPKAGNPPPVVYFNGYGNYVFKNVPVVITQFNVQLPQDCDYIACDVVGSAAGAIQGLTEGIGGLSDLLGGSSVDGIAKAANFVSEISETVGSIAGLAGTFGIGGSTPGGQARVPTKSSFSVTLVPVYSRTSARRFSLDRFVTGGYLNNPFGYI